MSPTNLNRLLVGAGLLVLSTAIVDAAADRQWDLAAVVGIALALQLVLAARLQSRRPAVPIRRDLVAFLRDRAVEAGEPMSAVVDRAVSAYRGWLAPRGASSRPEAEGRASR